MSKTLLVEAVRAVEAPASSWPPPDLPEFLQTILEQLDRLVDCDGCALLLLTDSTLRVAASRGFPDPAAVQQLRFNLKEQPHLRHLISEGRPVVTLDMPVAEPGESAAVFEGLHACIQAPLVYQARPIGLLLVLKTEPDYYSERDAQFAMAFANQAAMAIENARLYVETRRRALQLEAASQVSQKVAAILDIDELLPQVVRLIREAFGYYHVHLSLSRQNRRLDCVQYWWQQISPHHCDTLQSK